MRPDPMKMFEGQVKWAAAHHAKGREERDAFEDEMFDEKRHPESYGKAVAK
jgi:hypothetical protein